MVFFGVYTKNEKAEMRDFLSHFGFNHIVNLFVNYINLRTKFWVYERRKNEKRKKKRNSFGVYGYRSLYEYSRRRNFRIEVDRLNLV